MTKDEGAQIPTLIERLSRVVASETWTEGLNPTQAAALSYLARANRFSRAPSQVADYLSATRGTVSQTLKALQQKGLISEQRSPSDKRSISYDLTKAGRAAVSTETALEEASRILPDTQARALQDSLTEILNALLERRDGRPFGVCRSCRHHEARGKKGYCHLLEVELQPEEVTQICHEQEPAA